jgi:hypothetical protein
MSFSKLLKKVVAFTLFCFCSSGCREEAKQYEYIMYRDGQIKFWRDPIIHSFESYLENGDFIVNTQKGDTLIAGAYQNGYKTGRWIYNPRDTLTVAIDWTTYHSDDYSIEINYPQEWKVIRSEERLFQSTFETTSKIKDDKYFIVLEHEKSDLNITLKDYWKLFNEETHAKDSVISHLLKKFSRKDGDFYFSTYTIARNAENLFVFSFLGETDSKIYDITYSSLKEDIDRKYIIFLDIVRSIKVEQKRFFTPFGQRTKIMDLNWPPEIEIIS